MVGTTISHYKDLEKIGQGGMGEVYRTTDTKLNRDVALKILHEQFTSDSQRMGRFQREAEVLASMDHPNIGQIYGIEEAGQTKALVLQLRYSTSVYLIPGRKTPLTQPAFQPARRPRSR